MSATAALPSPYRLPTPGDNMRALVFAVLIHVAAALLMFVGVWTAVDEPMIDAGEPIDAVMIDLSAAPLPKSTPKPAPPKPAPAPVPAPEVKPEPPKPAPPEPQRVEAGKPDDVTDQRLAPPKTDVDPLAVAQEDERKRKLEQERRAQLEQIRQEREQAEKDRAKAEADLKRVQAQQQKDDLKKQMEAEARERARIAEQEAALRGTVQTEDLLAQWRNAVRQAIEQQWNLPTGTPGKVQCGIRITAVQGGTVVFRTITQPCQLPPELQQTLLDAVDAADPLPYLGFEAVFQTQIPIIFVTPESN